MVRPMNDKGQSSGDKVREHGMDLYQVLRKNFWSGKLNRNGSDAKKIYHSGTKS